VETPKPVVEKIAERTPVKDPAAKVAEKPEITPTAEPAAAPPQAKTEPKPAPREKAEPDPVADQIADQLKKIEPKKVEQPQQQVKIPAPPQKPAKPQPKFDPNKVAALLDKRDPRRQAAGGETLNSQVALGSPTGNAQSLSQNEIDALRAQIQACWNPPVGLAEAKDLTVLVRLMLNPDGTLSGEPVLLNRVSNPLFQVAAESAVRAIQRCQPYKLPIAKYAVWKDVEIVFDPRDMFR
jgi:colicin import membrane protein